MSHDTRWVWIPEPGGTWVLAFVYVDPSAGPSAKGGVVSNPPTPEEVRQAIDHPDRTFRQPAAFGATPISPEDALRLGLPKDPPWIGFFEKKPVPPPRGESSRTVTAVVHRRGVAVVGARVRMGYGVGPARELIPLDERTTDAAGRCEFPLAPTKPIVALADHQGASSKLVDVPESGTVELELMSFGAMEGDIRKDGIPVVAQVSITGRDGGVHRVERCDPRGHYRIEGVVPGRYDVKVEAIDAQSMTNGTPVFDEIAVGEGQATRRDYALVGGVSLHVTVLLEGDDHHGNVYLFAGSVAPRTLPELRRLYDEVDKTQRRSANSYSTYMQRMTTEFCDVAPGAYTVCVSPWDRRGEAHKEQPVTLQSVMVGAQAVSVELALPPLRPR